MEVDTEVVVGETGLFCLDDNVLVRCCIESQRAGEVSRAVIRAGLFAERLERENAGVHANNVHLTSVLEEILFIIFFEVEEDIAFFLGCGKNGLSDLAACGDTADFILFAVVLDVGNRTVVVIVLVSARAAGGGLAAVNHFIGSYGCGLDIGQNNAGCLIVLRKNNLRIDDRSCYIRKVDDGIAVTVRFGRDGLFVTVFVGIDEFNTNALLVSYLDENSALRCFDGRNRVNIFAGFIIRINVYILIPDCIQGHIAGNAEGGLDVGSVGRGLRPACKGIAFANRCFGNGELGAHGSFSCGRHIGYGVRGVLVERNGRRTENRNGGDAEELTGDLARVNINLYDFLCRSPLAGRRAGVIVHKVEREGLKVIESVKGRLQGHALLFGIGKAVCFITHGLFFAVCVDELGLIVDLRAARSGAGHTNDDRGVFLCIET